MTKERLEEASASEYAAGSCVQKENSALSRERGNKAFRAITLVALPLLWIGFSYSLYAGNESNMMWYSGLILMFSLLNADVLVKGEKLPNKVLNVLAKVNCVLLFAWAVIVIIHTLMK